jgi:hypothetical protein
VAHLIDVSKKKVASQLTVLMSHTALAVHTPESENISAPQFDTQFPFSRWNPKPHAEHDVASLHASQLALHATQASGSAAASAKKPAPQLPLVTQSLSLRK